ncbi:hypothetical protein E3N88_18815 [Mikania micrantha]|uniref:Uncharacterized protein n=1 Tax=Mikania micrantha TaxID=192012 RepID=A0A5N6NMW2_9ASTR|nr:hypothetical protein E3N88_18815 [Mikania micrantha]
MCSQHDARFLSHHSPLTTVIASLWRPCLSPVFLSPSSVRPAQCSWLRLSGSPSHHCPLLLLSSKLVSALLEVQSLSHRTPVHPSEVPHPRGSSAPSQSAH